MDEADEGAQAPSDDDVDNSRISNINSMDPRTWSNFKHRAEEQARAAELKHLVQQQQITPKEVIAFMNPSS